MLSGVNLRRKKDEAITRSAKTIITHQPPTKNLLDMEAVFSLNEPSMIRSRQKTEIRISIELLLNTAVIIPEVRHIIEKTILTAMMKALLRWIVMT